MKKILLVAILSMSLFGYVDCAKCHNGGYKSKLDIYTPAQIVSMLKQYKSGAMSGMMSSIVAGMSQKDMQDAAKKYGKK